MAQLLTACCLVQLHDRERSPFETGIWFLEAMCQAHGAGWLDGYLEQPWSHRLTSPISCTHGRYLCHISMLPAVAHGILTDQWGQHL